MNVLKMFGGVLVFRRVAASDMATGEAHSEMNPGIAHLHAIFANVLGGLGYLDLV